jgi:hypothetical protein
MEIEDDDLRQEMLKKFEEYITMSSKKIHTSRDAEIEKTVKEAPYKAEIEAMELGMDIPADIAVKLREFYLKSVQQIKDEVWYDLVKINLLLFRAFVDMRVIDEACYQIISDMMYCRDPLKLKEMLDKLINRLKSLPKVYI